MAQTKRTKDKRMFTIELRSKDDVKNISLDGDSKNIIEGSLGSLEHACFIDDLVLEIIGSNGVLRVDLAANDIRSPTKMAAIPKGGVLK
jgi:hypothetical protein